MAWRYAMIVLVVVAAALSGCATVLGGGSTQDVHIVSIPSQAHYQVKTLSGTELASGTTPDHVKLSRDRTDLFVYLSLEGHKRAKIHMSRSFNGWFLVNLAVPLAGLIGMLVDVSKGAVWKYVPEQINVELVADHETRSVPGPVDDGATRR